MHYVTFRTCLAVVCGLVLTAAGLGASPAAEQEPAAVMEKEMVRDPATGKMITAPQYGGTITFAMFKMPSSNTDSYIGAGHVAGIIAGLVTEKLGIPDWAVDRENVNALTSPVLPLANINGNLAESWETPDDTTIVFKIRQGIHFHDKAPANGRALVADDLAYNYQRMFALGRFAGKERAGQAWGTMALPIESVDAPDETTLVIKLSQPNPGALKQLLDCCHMYIYPPEAIEQHGSVTDWRNLSGTGPFMMTDLTEGTSVTYEKNSNYWRNDEKFPQNRLPYVDKVVAVMMAEEATRLAALRAGRIDYMGFMGPNTFVSSVDTVANVAKTNPEIEQWPFAIRSLNSFAMNVQKPPFDDIRVRQAMQMALDLETIHNSYHQGYGEWQPMGLNGPAWKGYNNPYETWPAEVKNTYSYDPEGARKLLAEAGYPDGFKTTLNTDQAQYDTGYRELVAGYWSEIGVEVEIIGQDTAQINNLVQERNAEGLIDFVGIGADYASLGQNFFANGTYNPGGISDSAFDSMMEAALAATSEEQQKILARETDMYAIRQQWIVWGPRTPNIQLGQPWLVGFNGEIGLGACSWQLPFSRLWIDQQLKEEMGH